MKFCAGLCRPCYNQSIETRLWRVLTGPLHADTWVCRSHRRAARTTRTAGA